MAGSGGLPQGPAEGGVQGVDGGTIGVGASPVAGESGFTGNAPNLEQPIQ